MNTVVIHKCGNDIIELVVNDKKYFDDDLFNDRKNNYYDGSLLKFIKNTRMYGKKIFYNNYTLNEKMYGTEVFLVESDHLYML